jgi:hypothetical protein
MEEFVLIAKCANGACSRAFDHLAGGMFFRFVRETHASFLADTAAHGVGNLHHAEHYWLCEKCLKAYTLIYIDGAGVVLKPRFAEFQVAQILKNVVAA